jgi:nucleoid DNA-binding protein
MPKTAASQSELVKALRSDPETIPGTLTNKQVAAVVTDLFNLYVQTLGAGEPIHLRHIGTLTPVVRAARQRRDPRTGQPLAVPAHWSVKFKPSRVVLDLINAVCGPPAVTPSKENAP